MVEYTCSGNTLYAFAGLYNGLQTDYIEYFSLCQGEIRTFVRMKGDEI